ncbi:MAG: dTMP kinase [Myxococcales bacterium]|nr:dTMP kinase [Myxococcales bacterium]
MKPEVRVEREGPVALLIVDRPKARNAIARKTMGELAAAIDQLAGDATLRAVVLGGGGGHFISGGDLRDLMAVRTAVEAAAMAARMQAVLGALEALPVPVIAAIERFAYGGGAEVALACDLRVMGHDAHFGLRQLDFAVTTAWGGTRRLLRLVGRSRALRLLWTAADVPASEALTLGLADDVARPGESARDCALRLARTLATRPAGAVAAMKRLVVEGADLDAAAHGRFEARVMGEVWAAPPHWAAVDAFFASRVKPDAALQEEAIVATASSTRGRFIVFEGLDGAGTTTQAALLTRWLRRQGRPVRQTAQPSSGPVGNLLRQAMGRRVVAPDGQRLDPRAIAGLFVADRADHLRVEIEPALAAGADVVCDRYLYSSLAYQGAECDPGWVASLNAPFPAPDVVLYVAVPVEVAAERRARRAGQPEIFEVDDFQCRVAEGYANIARWRPDDPVVTIDGARSPRAVQRDCRAAVARLRRTAE